MGAHVGRGSGDGSCTAIGFRARLRAVAHDRHGQRACCRRRAGLAPCRSTERSAPAATGSGSTSLDESTTNVGTNFGGGVKISLLGPLRVRVDYRVFKLSGDAVYETPQRFYVGANLAF